MNWKTRLRTVLLPQPSAERFCYRFPFYVNMICLGTLYVWYCRYDFFTYGAHDESDSIWLLNIFGVLSFLAAAFNASTTFDADKKTDYAGTAYLVLALIARGILFLSDLRHMNFFPSS